MRKRAASILAFLDSDDTWLPNHLESQMKQFEANPGLGLVYAKNHWRPSPDDLIHGEITSTGGPGF